MFTKAIVKQPCKNLVKGLTSANFGKPDYNLALKQHQKYIEALTECELEIKEYIERKKNEKSGYIRNP